MEGSANQGRYNLETLAKGRWMAIVHILKQRYTGSWKGEILKGSVKGETMKRKLEKSGLIAAGKGSWQGDI
jgi:hypothetical protein